MQGAGALKPKHGLERKNSKPTLGSSASHGSAGLLAMAELHRRRSQEQLLQAASNLNASASANQVFSNSAATASAGLSSSAMAQIARNASGK